MPIPLPTDQPSPARIVALAGAQLGVVAVHDQGHWRQAPVAVGGYAVMREWTPVALAWVSQRLPPGCSCLVLADAHARGPAGELPVVEVVLDARGTTLGQQLVRAGWALPDAQVLGADLQQPLAHGYVEALRAARRDHAGMWGEDAQAQARQLSALGPGWAAASAPPPTSVAPWLLLALVALLAAGLVARGASAAARPEAMAAAAAAPPRPRRWWWHVAGWYVRGTLPTPPPRRQAGRP